MNMATLHGRSVEHSPFSYGDPDAVLTVDACPQ
jgi:hypothetical protein